MYCVIQDIELKKANKYGYPKELESYFMRMSIGNKDLSHYAYIYSEERFDRPIKKAFKISIHKSYRENGKLKKKQFSLCTVNYYDFVDGWFNIYDYCGTKIIALSKDLDIDPDTICKLVEAKLDPLIDAIQNEFRSTEEYKTHKEHERITTVYAINKIEFEKKYNCNQSKYDEIYNVFGDIMDQKKLDQVEADFIAGQEYEEKSRSYQEQHYSNHNNSREGSYHETKLSNHSTEDKETLKQFYRLLSKKFHPDANPENDTSKQMQLLNQIKTQWGI